MVRNFAKSRQHTNFWLFPYGAVLTPAGKMSKGTDPVRLANVVTSLRTKNLNKSTLIHRHHFGSQSIMASVSGPETKVIYATVCA